MQLIHEIPQPVIGQVQGGGYSRRLPAGGPGCDLLIAEEGARFATPGGGKIGLFLHHPPWWAITRAIGRKAAMENCSSPAAIFRPVRQRHWVWSTMWVPLEALAAKNRGHGPADCRGQCHGTGHRQTGLLRPGGSAR